MYRRQAGLRQIDVARKLGHTSSDRISHWEKGLAVPGLTNLFKLSIIYAVSPENLYPQLHKDLIAELKYQHSNKSVYDILSAAALPDSLGKN